MHPETSLYHLRQAVESDFPNIRKLIHQVNNNPMGLEWPNFILAVDARDQMIGCGQVKKHGDGSLELASIAVIPEMRSNGVASAIIRQLISKHPGRLYLTCHSGLGSFYQRFDFRIADDALLPPYFRRIHRMVRLLRSLHLTPGEGLLFMVKE